MKLSVSCVAGALVACGGHVETEPTGHEAERIASAAPSRDCRVWRLAVAGEALRTFEHPGGAPRQVLASAPVDLTRTDERLYAIDETALERWHGDRPGAETVVGDGLLAAPEALAAAGGQLYVAGGLGLVRVEPPTPNEAIGLRFVDLSARYEALAALPSGVLFGADRRGRVVRIATPPAPQDAPVPAMRSEAWKEVTDLAIGVDGSLYVASGTDTVHVVDNPELRTGPLEPDKSITLPGSRIEGLAIAPDGTGFLADPVAGRVHAVRDVSDAYPRAEPSYAVETRGARRVTVLPPCT